MSETVVDPGIGSALARLHCAVGDLMTLPVDALTDDDLLALSRGVETERRRLAVVDHRLITG